MKSKLLSLACLPVLVAICIPLFASLERNGSPREKPPEGWINFAWPEKKKVLLDHFAPTPDELALIESATPDSSTSKPKKKRRILLYYRCGWPHSSIATGIAAFEKMGQKTGVYELEVTDESSAFSKENLEKFDAILLNNSVGFEKFLNSPQRDALLEFVKNGKGLIGIHAAADSNKEWAPGAELIGGVFQSHPWTSKGTWASKVESPLHPLNAAFKNEAPYLRDEIYHYRAGSFSRDRSRVLLSLDMTHPRNSLGQGIQQKAKSSLEENMRVAS